MSISRFPLWTFVLACTLVASGGCAQLREPAAASSIQQRTEPELGRDYLLYVPSTYDRTHAWPVIVVCHGTFPDSPRRQLAAWTDRAESQGFLVVAPRLSSATGLSAPKPPEQIERQRIDEAHILNCLRHVRGGHTISEDRVFLYGWKGGGAPALHTGLRHPDVFRAIGVAQPNFDPAFLADTTALIDHHQPVSVCYGVTDVFKGRDGRTVADWLAGHGVDVRVDRGDDVRHDDTAVFVAFFESAIRREPWVLIQDEIEPGNPQARRFRVRAANVPVRFQWNFGDGDESPVAEPVHIFAQPGSYRVSVEASFANGTTVTRTRDVVVP